MTNHDKIKWLHPPYGLIKAPFDFLWRLQLRTLYLCTGFLFLKMTGRRGASRSALTILTPGPVAEMWHGDDKHLTRYYRSITYAVIPPGKMRLMGAQKTGDSEVLVIEDGELAWSEINNPT